MFENAYFAQTAEMGVHDARRSRQPRSARRCACRQAFADAGGDAALAGGAARNAAARPRRPDRAGRVQPRQRGRDRRAQLATVATQARAVGRVQLAVCCTLLVRLVGARATLAGAAVTLLAAPLNDRVLSATTLRKRLLAAADARVARLELLGAIRYVKTVAWEPPFAAAIARARARLAVMRARARAGAALVASFNLVPSLMAVALLMARADGREHGAVHHLSG